MTRRPHLDLIEHCVTRDRAVTFRDGSWGTVRVLPPGLGWTVAIDGERWTKWQRRRVVLPFPKRIRSGGWSRPR
jgi:hypothetical protein